MLYPDIILELNPSVDIYKIDDDRLEFYFMTTRQRIAMNVSEAVISLINGFDGIAAIGTLCEHIGIDFEDDNVQNFLQYLLHKKILLIPAEEEQERKVLSDDDLCRYDRQLNYFNSSFPSSAYEIQNVLQSTKVLIFGLGAIGSGIAMQLVMSGVRHLILVDKDIVSKDSLERHFMFTSSDVGRSKVEAFSDFLKRIDSKVECSTYHQIIDYDTPIDALLDNSDFVINTLDEPYIGHTSMKIGRGCFVRDLPLYVAGGFDAHLMSTGELIVPNKTPCVDCYVSYFSESLKEWQPQYNVGALTETEIQNSIFEVGGLASMSLFSVSYAVIVILSYIATKDASYSKGRGELLFDSMEINYLNVSKNPQCHVCGIK